MNKQLHDVLNAFSVKVDVADCEVNNLQIDSRKVNAGDVFVALPGTQAHGLTFVEQAIAAGCVAVLYDQCENHIESEVPVIHVPNLADILGDVAHQFYGRPSESMKVLAVTGTNGKTSVAWFLMQALNQSGHKAAYIGTLGTGTETVWESSVNTTPSVVDIHRLMASFVEQQVTHVCMEVSSHALHQGRINGVFLDQTMFTNLTRDHLDYHQTMSAYAEAKFQLFDQYASSSAIINSDDETGAQWLQRELNASAVYSYSIKSDADWCAVDVKTGGAGLSFTVKNQSSEIQVNSSLMGLFNVENMMLVAASLGTMGTPIEMVGSLLSSLKAVPGRMNVISGDVVQATWVVDYAHTPDALASVLKSLKKHVKGQLICIFGCGGDRDKGKRALMGQVAESWSDVVIVTDDNPRFESPERITNDIVLGMVEEPVVIHQRRLAIAHVMEVSQAGDVVLVAGKGHEDYQEIEGERTHYNDAETIQELFEVAA